MELLPQTADVLRRLSESSDVDLVAVVTEAGDRVAAEVGGGGDVRRRVDRRVGRAPEGEGDRADEEGDRSRAAHGLRW